MAPLTQEAPKGLEKEKSILQLRDELEILKVQDFVTYDRCIGEIARWAMGVSDEKRMTLHPSKTDDDFAQLLESLGEDLLSGAQSEEKAS